MKRFMLAILLTFGVTVSIIIGAMLTVEDMPGALLIGAIVGGLLILAATAGHRLNARMTAAVVAAYKPTGRATGHVSTLAPIGARYGLPRAPQANVEAAADDWRDYSYQVPTKTRTYRRHPLGTADSSAPMVETMTPARAPDVRSDFTTPALQSLFSALVAGLVAAVVAWRTGGDVLTWLIVGGVAGLTVCWLAALGLARSLVWKIERVMGSDIDGDGQQGKPDDGHLLAVQPETARQNVAGEVRQRAADDRLTWLIGFVTRCYTLGTSESAQGIKPGERAKYCEARDLLLRLGLADWRHADNHRLGWDMTTSQASAIKTIREHVTTI